MSSFQYLGRSVVPGPVVPVVSSCGHVAPIGVGDGVVLVEDVPYRIQNLFPADGTVVLQKIKTLDRAFKRFISLLWVPPPPTSDSSADLDRLTSKYLCPVPEPPCLLPDTSDCQIRVDILEDQALDTWCSLMTDYSSVEHLHRVLEETNAEA